jgi:hypothetical protein
MDDLGILEEENVGQDLRFYVYNYDHNEVVSWFDTYEEAENYIKAVARICGVE